MSATPPDKVPAPPGVILVADDEESIRWVLERACAKDGHTVHAVGSGREALAALRERAYDVALIDIRMPDLSGLEVLTRAREDHIDTLFIIMTAQNTMANAIEATKRGAYDYLTKPFDLDQVEVLVGRAMELRRLTRDLERLRGELEQRDELVVGKTSAMQEVYKVIGRAAPTEATVLIQGETGTGKELVAKTIHYHSERRGPFVALNCSAIPNELLESELFGYERGAFTGAVERRIGKFEAAAGGTLFLDEIADMSLALQVKLLRVLQEREFTRVGGRDALRADVRIIAASNQDLEAAVRARGRTLVPEDFALAGQPRQTSTDVLPLEEAVRHRLAELLERDAGVPVGELHATLISAVERPLIEIVLERSGGNQVKAAEMLGINRNTLRKKISELGIEIRRPVSRRGGAP